jgi:RNA polymerase sigma-70 factor (ECF subfamily)
MDDKAREAELERAFLEMLETHAPRLRRIASSYARGPDRGDLYQEILCALWRSLPGFRGDAALGTWVYRVALNTALSHARLRKRRPPEVQAAADALTEPATAGDPAREDAILQDFLASLGEIDRSLLILYLDGFSHEEISQVTGLRPGAVGVRLHRIKRSYERRYLEGLS